jgi:hypothetical protein
MSAPSIDVATSGTSTASSTVGTGASVSTSGTNRVLLAFVTCDKSAGAAPTVNSITDTAGLVWTKIFGNTLVYTVAGTGLQTRLEVWWAPAAAQLSSDTVTATFSASATGAHIDVASFSGCNSISAPFDVNGSNPSGASDVTGTSGVPDTLLSTTSVDTTVLGMYYGGRNSIGNGAGFTTIANGFIDPATNQEYFTALGYQSFSAVQTNLAVNANGSTTFWGMFGVALSGDPPPAAITKSQAMVIC